MLPTVSHRRIDMTSNKKPNKPGDPVTPVSVSITKAAGLLGISKSLCYQLIARGDIPTIRIGEKRRLCIYKDLIRYADGLRAEQSISRWNRID